MKNEEHKAEIVRDCFKIINLGRKGKFPSKLIKEQLARAYNKGYESATAIQCDEIVDKVVAEVKAYADEKYGVKEE